MLCVNCDQPTTGSSKYCPTHRAEARAAWKARIEVDNAERAAREVRHQEIITEAAHAAGLAYDNCEPQAMLVYETVGLSDMPKEDGKAWLVAEGVCGFAWLVVTPATSSFARWCAKKNIGYKAYQGGWTISANDLVPNAGQSYERKLAAMTAAAAVLRGHGITCRVDSRLD